MTDAKSAMLELALRAVQQHIERDEYTAAGDVVMQALARVEQMTAPAQSNSHQIAVKQPEWNEREQFEAWSKREGAVNLRGSHTGACEDGRFPATYWYAPTETAWRAWANKPAAQLAAPAAPALPNCAKCLGTGQMLLQGKRYGSCYTCGGSGVGEAAPQGEGK